LPIQYADFAYWQRQWLQGSELERQLGYWQQKLAGAPALLPLPTDHPRPAVQRDSGKTATFRIDKVLAQQLSERAKRSGATLYMTLLAAFSVFLSRYSQTTDIVVGSPIANRNRKELEPLIGFFANTLLMRTQLTDALTFADVVNQVRQTALEAYTHQDMPFEKLVEVLRPERNRSYNPLFQVMFVLHNMSVNVDASLEQKQATDRPTGWQTMISGGSEKNSSANNLSTRSIGIRQTTAKFDISLSVVETPNGLHGSWIYNTDLFKPETIEKMSGQFQALLADIVRSPDKAIDALSMLSVAEQEQQKRDRKLQSQIAKLSPAKRALLERKLRERQRSETIVPRAQKGETVLSFAQQNLWLLDQLNPGNPGYNRPTHICLVGALDTAALEQSLNALVQRHAILRTRFTTSAEGKPVQTVLADVPAIALQTEKLTQLSEPEQQQIVQERAIAQAHTHFDLTQAPLIKAQLLQLSGEARAEEHILLLTFHHIVFDGWSTSILLRDLGLFYDAFVTGQSPALPALPVQYADFALWQQQQLQTPQMEEQLAYWKKQLGGQLPILELPTDRPRTANVSDKGGEHTFTISQSLKVSLSAIAQQENATLFMLLLAAFKTLLYRYTQEEDIIIGSPIAGRNTVETEQLIGLFANTLVLRTGLQGEQTFQSLLKQLRQVALDAFAHQGIPLPKLVEALQIDRDLSRSTLFQILFQFKNLPEQTIQAQGISIQESKLKTNIASLDLSLEIKEQTEGLSCLFKYDANLFEDTTIYRMGTHFVTLLQSVVNNPQETLSRLTLLPPSERSQIAEWSTATEVVQPVEPHVTEHRVIEHRVSGIHELFERQVEQVPHEVALSYQSQQLTYQALNQKANQLARRLRQLGVQADVPVGIYLARSPQLLIALLAVLKAGGAYVPLDAEALPTERVTYVLEDTQAPVLITTSDLKETLVNFTAAAICLDTDWTEIEKESTENLDGDSSPQDLAYIIYTSGSTGKPKGTMIEHRGVIDAFYSWHQAYQLSDLSSHLQLAGFSFDVFTGDWVRALCSGAKLVLCPADLRLEPAQLYQLMRSEHIDCGEFVPGIIRILMQYLRDSNQSLDFMKCLIVGSDTWYMHEYRQLQTFCGPTTRLINSYGLTEDTIDSTYFELSSGEMSPNSSSGETSSDEPLADESLVPIGRPFANKQLFILNEHHQPTPIGIPGELYIGGSGLARGYLNRPHLTAEKFVSIPRPLSGVEVHPPIRLYKTGDLARYLPDGNIDFLGRKDFQVKIRGSRIELGEIETALLKMPTVQGAVVIAQQDPATNTQRLVAYLTRTATSATAVNSTSENTSLDTATLADRETPDWRALLKQQLPDYMVPSAFVVLDVFPLTPSGKVDRKRLPQPDFSQLSLASQYEAPTTSIEKTLVALWSQALNIEQVGINDDFFELGGHSLLAVQLFSEIEKTFGKKLPLATLFQATTVKSLAVVLDQEDWSAPWQSLVAIKPQGTKPPLFYLHAGGGNLLVYRDLALSLGEDQPVYGLQPRGLDGSLLPSSDIREMATFYISQIKTLQPKGPYYLAGLSTGGLIAWEMAQQLHQQNESVALLALLDTGGPGYPRLLPIAPRIVSVVNWLAADTWQRVKRGLPQLVENTRQEGFVASWKQVLRKLNLIKPLLPEPLSPEPLSPEVQQLSEKSIKPTLNKGTSVPEDSAVIADLLSQRFNRSIARYKQQNAGKISLEVRINLLLAQLLRRSSQSYYANYFTKGLFKQSNRQKPVNETSLPSELRQVEAANRRAKRQYVPQPYPGKVVLFRATDRAPGIAPDPKLGWAGMTGEDMEIYNIPGAHTSMIRSPLLARYLKECLAHAQSRTHQIGDIG
ncbi:MAG: amino acid adenylation domain-containing protein, partial [Cyanobacteria bacterium J06632_3]